MVKLPFEKHLVVQYLGIQSESLSRNLAKLKAHGIQTTADGTDISNPDALREIVGEEALMLCDLPA
jgi:CRP-like cAMP-binding protein